MAPSVPKRKRATNSDIDANIINEVLTSEDGAVSLRINLDLNKLLRERALFTDALKMARGLPFDMDLVQASDPIALYVAAQRPGMLQKNSNAAVNKARQYYANHIQKAESDALILTLLASHENDWVLDAPAKPYDIKPEDLPSGILNIPEPDRDLSDPVENRLRRFYQVMEEHMEMLGMFQKAFNLAMGALAVKASTKGGAEETDEQGFQPNSIN